MTQQDFKYAQVLVNISKLGTRTFSYMIPDEMKRTIKIGQPVLVPFGNQGMINAFVVGFSDYLPEHIKAKEIAEILDDTPAFSLEYLNFLDWVSRYYCCDIQTVFACAIPTNFFAKSTRVVRLISQDMPLSLSINEQKLYSALLEKNEILSSALQKKLTLSSSKFYEALRKLKLKNIISVENEIVEKSAKTKTTKIIKFLSDETTNKRYLLILEKLKQNDGQSLSEFIKEAKTTLPTLKKLEKEHLVKIEEKEVYRNPLDVLNITQRDKFPQLNPEQRQIFEHIKHSIDEKEITPILLHGITGSGKTEIYFRAMDEVIKKGKNVIFLAPEIALASQLAKRIAKRFGTEEVAIWHSSISEGEKYDVWKKLQNNSLKIIAGARSAIFAPIKNIGLIIIDEEHESSYKQTTPAPRYDARTLAKELSKRTGALLIEGSATPDIDSYYRASNSNRVLTLTKRFGNAKLADVKIIDMRREYHNNNFSIFSRELRKALKNNLEEKKQSLLLINRRGYSTYIQCLECGHTIECRRCAIPLIYHSDTNTLKCHYCNYETPVITKCPECGSEAVKNYGIGTQRVEADLKKEFPDAKIERLDSDAMKTKRGYIDVLNRFANQETDILVGTQMIAKGLDNPNVTLVGVISADSTFNFPDYRSAERGFQLLTQVAGRAGRGDFEGKVYFQTYTPDFYALENAKNQDYLDFFHTEIDLRNELAYPPFSQIIRLVASSKNMFRAERLCQEIALKLNEITDKQGISERLEILGPAPCLIGRIKDEYRFQIIIKNRLEERGHFFITSFIQKIIIPDDIKFIVDIDPIDML